MAVVNTSSEGPPIPVDVIRSRISTVLSTDLIQCAHVENALDLACWRITSASMKHV